MKSFRGLRVWQESIDLAELVYRASEDFPRREHFGLAAQMRKAAVSVPSNIAEGQGRRSTRDWLQFLAISRGSMYELETQLVIAERLGYIDAQTSAEISKRLNQVGPDLGAFIRYVESRSRR